MVLKLTYSELLHLLEQRFHIKPEIIYIDENTVEVKPAGIKITAAECENNCLVLDYQCNLISAMMISAIQGFLERKLPDGVEFKTSEKKILVDLKRIPSLKKAIEHLTVTALKADEESLNLHLSLKAE